MMKVALVSALLLTICIVGDGCVVNGVKKENGDTWAVNGLFVLECIVEENGWRTKAVGCVSPNGKELLNGETVEEDGKQYGCSIDGKGNIRLTQGTHVKPCKPEDNWTIKSFEFKCDANGLQQFIGCVTESGRKMEPNSEVEEGSFVTECREMNGHYSIKSYTKTAHKTNSTNTNMNKGPRVPLVSSCNIDGKKYNHGGIYRQGNFLLKCVVGDTFWKTEAVGCLTESGTELKAGETKTEENVTYKCTTNNQGQIRMDRITEN